VFRNTALIVSYYLQNCSFTCTYAENQFACLQCESKKSRPEDLWQFFQNGWEFFNQILLCVPIYARLQIFIELPATLTKLCHIKRDHPVHIMCAKCHHRPKRTLEFSDIFSKQLGIFRPNFTRLLKVHTYTRMQFFIHLSPTVTKLCHIKCDTQRAFRSMVDILSTLWWSRLIWHNFVKVAGNWIQICSPV